MKKIFVTLAALASTALLSSCGTSSSALSGVGQSLLENALTGSSSSSSNAQSGNVGDIVQGLLTGLLQGQGATLSQQTLQGTWKYTGSECAFESDNFLAKAGGALASSKIEAEINEQLAKIGISEGACSFTFNKDNTYKAVIGKRTIEGEYTLDAANNSIKMTYLRGLASMNPRIAMKGGNLYLMFESDKLLSLVKGMSALSNSTSLKTVSALLDKYDGMYVGMRLSK